jgi:hypothetical protein
MSADGSAASRETGLSAPDVGFSRIVVSLRIVLLVSFDVGAEKERFMVKGKVTKRRRCLGGDNDGNVASRGTRGTFASSNKRDE